MIQSGFWNPIFFKDFKNYQNYVHSKGYDLTTIAKGGINTLGAIYASKKYSDIIDIVSTQDGEISDKTDAYCYVEQFSKKLEKGIKPESYTSDDLKEVKASKEASKIITDIIGKDYSFKSIYVPIKDHQIYTTPKILDVRGNEYKVNSLDAIIQNEII